MNTVKDDHNVTPTPSKNWHDNWFKKRNFRDLTEHRDKKATSACPVRMVSMVEQDSLGSPEQKARVDYLDCPDFLDHLDLMDYR